MARTDASTKGSAGGGGSPGGSDTQLQYNNASSFGGITNATSDGTDLILSQVKFKDSDASHELILKEGANLTADRTLTLTTSDADQAVSLLGDWTFTEQADGFTVASGSTSERTLELNGANVEIQGSGTNTYTFPSSSQTIPGLTDSVTLTNKELGSGTKINPGSTAKGDWWYSGDTSGTLTTQSIGSANQFIRVNATADGFTYADGVSQMMVQNFTSGGDSVAATRYIGFGHADATLAHAQRLFPKGTIKEIYAGRESTSGTMTFKLYKNGTHDSSADIVLTTGLTGNVTGLNISTNGTTDYIAMEAEETSPSTTGNAQCIVYYEPADP